MSDTKRVSKETNTMFENLKTSSGKIFLQHYFGMTEFDACRYLGITFNELRDLCKIHNIKIWPDKQMKYVSKLVKDGLISIEYHDYLIRVIQENPHVNISNVIKMHNRNSKIAPKFF